ncbi:siderophore-interacting protein [Nocardioides pakistanensis]
MTAASETRPAPFRMFDVRVLRVRRLSPSFVRLTFSGPDLDAMADNGFDQRIKLILPLPGSGLVHLPRGEDWYSAWRLLPESRRNPIRTYTIRHLRPAAREVDIDMVLHGDEHGVVSGPAARFALGARVGDEAVLLGPNGAHRGPHGGLEFRPHSSHASLLLAADETGVPAVANIVRSLPSHAVGQVLLEVPHPDDRFDLGAPPGVAVTWAARGSSGHGSHLLRMVTTADLPRPVVPAALPTAAEHDDLSEVLWEVPDPVETPVGDTGDPTDGFYAWVAGEASTVRAIRRHLVNERGHDRRSIAFMGYWRLGRAEC